jgi:hypothetical protein
VCHTYEEGGYMCVIHMRREDTCASCYVCHTYEEGGCMCVHAQVLCYVAK